MSPDMEVLVWAIAVCLVVVVGGGLLVAGALAVASAFCRRVQARRLLAEPEEQTVVLPREVTAPTVIDGESLMIRPYVYAGSGDQS